VIPWGSLVAQSNSNLSGINVRACQLAPSVGRISSDFYRSCRCAPLASRESLDSRQRGEGLEESGRAYTGIGRV